MHCDRRRRRIFGVGAAKTGTHSLAAMFADVCATAHEADSGALIRRVLRGSDQRRNLRVRDYRRRLTIDSSQVNLYLLEDIRSVWPDALFVMTVRHPVDWIRSIVDDSQRRETGDLWHQFRDFRFGEKAALDSLEYPLAQRGLYTIDGYLKYWLFAVSEPQRVLTAQQLLTVRTDELAQRCEELATFMGVPVPADVTQTAHSFANLQRSSALAELPPDYLADRLETICGPDARRLFPNRSISVALDSIASPPG